MLDKCKLIAEDIYNELGIGFDEPIYQKAFEVALRLANIPYDNLRVVPVFYKGYNVGEQKIDLVIRLPEDNLIIELKAIITLSPKEQAQLQKYMELLKVTKGMLINFTQCGTAKTKDYSNLKPEIVVINDSNTIKEGGSLHND